MVPSCVTSRAGAIRNPVPYHLRAGLAIEFLLARGTLPVLFWLKKDILFVPVEREGRNLEKFAERIRLLESQNANGSWINKRAPTQPPVDMENLLFETIRKASRLRDLGCECRCEALGRAAGFVFSTQTRDGVFQGPDRPEQSPITHALALELLCRLGHETDKRVHKGFRWLFKKQRADGGWGTPSATQDSRFGRTPGRKHPASSPRMTGIILRAMAESPRLQRSRETRRAGEFLAGRIFPDKAGVRTRASDSWEEMTYPFWAANILSGLDVLSKIGFTPDKGRIPPALDWLMRRQVRSGYWEAKQEKASAEDNLWITLSVLRVLKQFGLIRR
jgi:hypothetical protein